MSAQAAFVTGSSRGIGLAAALALVKRGLAVVSHRTAGAGGFVDITARAKRIVFSGTFNAGAKLRIDDGALAIDKEGHTAKFVESVDQVSFSGRQAAERCLIEMRDCALVVTVIAPGIDLKRDVLERADMELKVANDVREMDPKLFRPESIGHMP